MNFEPNMAELEEWIHRLGSFGYSEEGGLFRPVYSRQWFEARSQLENWMKEAGLETRVDAVGNLIGRLSGQDAGADVVLTGSHFDTVRGAGKLDGTLGVLTSIAALKSIAHCGKQPRRTIEVVAFCEEEGSRFPISMLGSRALFGKLTPDEIVTQRDAEGELLTDVWRRCGIDSSEVFAGARTDIDSFLELHIEQGGILESLGEQTGIVSGIVAQIIAGVRVTGTQNHAGTTPMSMRSDALVAAAEMVLALEQIALDHAPTTATVGVLNVQPGSANVIPGSVEFSIDTRNPSTGTLSEVWDLITSELSIIAARRGVTLEIPEVYFDEATAMAESLVHLLQEQARELELQTYPMFSGAGHDSQIAAQYVPTGMIFTPSKGGISHSPEEWTEISDIAPGAKLLAHALWARAER